MSQRGGWVWKVYCNDVKFKKISSAKPKGSFTVISLNITEESLGAKNFASL